MSRRGAASDHKSELFALDVRTGAVSWRMASDATTSWLAYSEEHECLVQGVDRLTADGDYQAKFQMVVYQGADGDVRWSRDQRVTEAGCILRGDELICGPRGYSLLTGESRWSGYTRNKGCDVPLAGQHLLLFRSSMAGYLDLDRQSGVGNWGGFRSACNGSLIAADGVLSAPKSAQGCDCNIPNQTSLALIHMPDVEIWSQGGRREESQGIGINLGAPGDRLSEGGVFWLDFPSVGGRSPDVPVRITPEQLTWFRHHSSRIADGPLPWVTASGVEGLRSVSVSPDKKTERATVRLYFCEPNDVEPGDRIFDVLVQGRPVLDDFDIVAFAGGRNRGIVQEFPNVAVGEELKVDLIPTGGTPNTEPILCGIEIVKE